MKQHPTPIQNETEMPPESDIANIQAAQAEKHETIQIPVVAIVALLLSIGAMFMSWQNRQNIPQNIKVVDLAEMSRFYQEQARQQGLKDGVSEAQRAQILQTLQFKMNVLQKTVDEYVQSCHCNIWVKSAIVGRNQQVEDITPMIMDLVNGKVAQAGLMQMPVQNPPATNNRLPENAVSPLNQSNTPLIEPNNENSGMSPAFPKQ